MRQPQWATLDEYGFSGFRSIIAFLSGRLEERATIDWALRLKPNDTIKRLALLELIDGPEGRRINEPWKSAWRLIEESWGKPTIEDHASTTAVAVQHRLQDGERSGSIVELIVELIAPRLKVEPFSDLQRTYHKPPKRPKRVEDLFSISLTSGFIADPVKLGLGSITERSFLVSLSLAIDAAVVNGLEIARRFGWDEERRFWQLGQLHRVYYLPTSDHDGEYEPDRFHRGIAPSVKLLHAVVSRLVDIDILSAVRFVHQWKLRESPVHIRLWATMASDSRVTPADEAGTFLLSLDDRRFWDLHEFPEIAELRAKRFSEFSSQVQSALISRIRKRPPKNQWPKKIHTDRLKSERLYWALRELRRIEIAGAHLSKRDKVWLDGNKANFPDLDQMARLDEGFWGYPKVPGFTQNPDRQYDLLAGEERLKALESSLSSARRSWEDESVQRAEDWIKQPENPLKIIADFESVPDGGADFVRVWERFGWAHSQNTVQDKDSIPRILALLENLPETTVRQAIDGLSHWLSIWKKQVANLSEGLSVWFKFWPIAVEFTNAEKAIEEEIKLSAVAQSSGDNHSMDYDTLNTPPGKLVGVFLSACPKLNETNRPFDINGTPRKMRDAIMAATGRSAMIARHRMIASLPYFLKADPEWSNEHLIKPLIADNSEARDLWRAIALRRHSSEVLRIIGDNMAACAIDRKIDRETRHSLVFTLVIECLYAFWEERDPAVSRLRIQQMIRLLDDEARAYGAEAVQRFVADLSAPHKGNKALFTPERLFRSAAAPFLKQVWPQERSLATPGVSQALVKLPAIVVEAFAEVVEAIERFLVPFQCWSMIEYGLYGEVDGRPKISIIDNGTKAAGLLKLFDLTIGTAEGSVIPLDLADALDQVQKVAPNLAEKQVFRRLATTARRGRFS
ncbi:MAG: hypothetical protein HZA15_15055 [Nitrospirae bacterium]|nr:hypothetical protein [Nitrospirota bacterium]